MDVDPPRFNDNRPPYQRRLTPPPTTDRARGIYPPPSPPRTEPAYVESDRRYVAGDRRDYAYDGRQRQLSGPDEDSYWKSRSGTWDREAIDKDRVERGVRNNGWETREERERRSSFPGSPSARSFDTPQQRPLGSRLTEGYPGEDRVYPPRELERSRYPPTSSEGAAFSRVRPRSPSPISRRPGPGSVVDDGRPPVKRPREDASYAAGYYSPEPRRPVVTGGPTDYPPRSAATPRPESASYYDARVGPPVPPSGSRNGPSYDRDYPVARDRATDIGYTPGPSYDRPPRSPPPSRLPPPPYGGRGNYTRGGGDPRDDRPYNSNMPPPPRSN